MFQMAKGNQKSGNRLLLSQARVLERKKKKKMAHNVVLNAVKLALIFTCVGWISLWVLKPTRTWSRTWKEAEDSFTPTLLGYYGLDFVVYSFPVIGVAIIGSVYMSLKLRKPKMRNGNKAFFGLSNPLIVNDFVGTLSAVEILSVVLFAVFLVWTFYTRISYDFKNLIPTKTLEPEIWKLKYMKVATRFGLLSEACLALLLLPILRGISLFRLLGVQFEASVRYHAWLGTTMICFSTIHGLIILFIWGVNHQLQEEIWKWQRKGRIYLAGEISLVAGLVIWITSLPQIRRRKFEIFYYTHHLYIVFIVFFLFHTGDRHFYSVFGGVFLFALDKLLRVIQSRPETSVISAKSFPCKAVELVLPKDPKLKYTPTSVVFVKIPSISKLQWHSFSITSSSSFDEHTMSLLIRCQGSWTSSLYNLINGKLESDSDKLKSLSISVEGPYGPASTDFLRYDSLLLVAGGIGITPFLSIIQEIASLPKNLNHLPKKIQLVYVAKKSHDICLLNSIAHIITNQSYEQELDLILKFYVTREQQTDTTLRDLLTKYSQIETVQFGTYDLSHAINGLESFVSMSYIAGFSSFVFLVFLICFNHIFVPDLHSKTMKEAKEKTSSTVLDLIIICSFTVALISASLVARVVRWRRMKRGAFPSVLEKHVKSWQTSSIESGLDLNRHEIHFTGRPNFQDVFTKFQIETGGSDVGVLVCGPEAMKESVALICRKSSQSLFKIGSEKKTSFSFHSLNFAL